MTADDDLLRRIETEPELAGLLAWLGDVDIERRDPVEELRIPSGSPLTPVAGDGSGGTYFLCGDPGGPRPVLYADSEGGATLLAAGLVEAVTLVAAYPYWRDLAHGHTVQELDEQITADSPGFPKARAKLLALLDVVPPTAEDALARLRSSAARTVPDFLPIARHEEGDSSYEATYTPLL